MTLKLIRVAMDHKVVEGHTDIRTFHIRPQSWLSFCMERDPSILAGPGITDPRPVFAVFWEAYRLQHGQHVAFNAHNDRLGNLIPLMLHGDEGRSLKKAPFLITSIESPIGGTKRPGATAACSCGSYMCASPHLPRFGNLNPNLLSPDVMKACREMFTNYRGHSFLSRFFLFGVAGCGCLRRTPTLWRNCLPYYWAGPGLFLHSQDP